MSGRSVPLAEMYTPDTRASRWATVVGWTVLTTLLAATFYAATIHDRSGWAGLVAGEATYLMQAESLAWDGDLRYTRADFDRFHAHWRSSPTDLSLASVDGRRIAYARPFPYAMWLAPFVRAAPDHGFAIANALLLIIATVVAARAVSRTGAAGPLWIVLFAFGSVTVAYVFLATGDLFLLTVAVVAGVLVGDDGAHVRAWMASGALMAILAASAPLLLVLPLALLVVAGRDRRGSLLVGLLAGGVVLAVVAWWYGGWPLARTFTFSVETGFPLVDFPATDWLSTVHRLDALYEAGGERWRWGLDPSLAWANVRYLLAGRHIGLLPYFLPVLLLVPLGLRGGRRSAWFLAAGAWLFLTLLLRPFDLFGGPGAVGNRYFLPVYGLLWLTIARPGRLVWALPVTALAALFLMPVWRTPWQEPLTERRGYQHTSAFAEANLPYETSQRWLPGSATEDVQGLWLRPLSGDLWIEARRGRLVLRGGGQAELLIASGRTLDALRLDFGPEAPSTIEVTGGDLGERLLGPGGGIGFRVDQPQRLAHHPLWWTPVPQHLYRLTIRFPDADERLLLPFELVGERFTEDSN